MYVLHEEKNYDVRGTTMPVTEVGIFNKTRTQVTVVPYKMKQPIGKTDGTFAHSFAV